MHTKTRAASATSLAALALLCAPATAQDATGASPTTTVDGRTLQLNGSGLRTQIVRLYQAALYLEEPTTDADVAIQSRQVKRVELHLLRDLGAAQVGDTIRQGFERNSADQMPALEDRLSQLIDHLGDLERGTVFSVTWVPDQGTTVEAEGMAPITLPGEDFARALFAVWLGPEPAQASLKDALLSGGG